MENDLKDLDVNQDNDAVISDGDNGNSVEDDISGESVLEKSEDEPGVVLGDNDDVDLSDTDVAISTNGSESSFEDDLVEESDTGSSEAALEQQDDQASTKFEKVFQKGTEELASRVIVREGERRHPTKISVKRRTILDDESFGVPRQSVPDDAPMLLLISGSPRKHTSVSLVDLVERGAREKGLRTQKFLLNEKRINPCIGCGACEKTGTCVFAGKISKSKKEFDDDYLELIGLLDRCDGLAVIAPVYFAGPTAQLKALYDRLQPYWVRKYLLGQPFPKRRPAQLFVVGTGGDPHGHEPIVTISKSALQIAGFELEKVNNFVGYLAPSDAPIPFDDKQLENASLKEISDNEKACAKQEEFTLRAIEAGRSFVRIIN